MRKHQTNSISGTSYKNVSPIPLEAMKTIKTRDWKTARGDKTTKWCVLSWMGPVLRKMTIGKNLNILYKAWTLIMHEYWILVLSCLGLSATPWTVAGQATLSMGFSSRILGWVVPFLLQRIFPTQGWNLGLPHCRQFLYPLSYQGSPSGSLIVTDVFY